MKLNPDIPDLSIPELMARVEQEKQDDKRNIVAMKGKVQNHDSHKIIIIPISRQKGGQLQVCRLYKTKLWYMQNVPRYA